MKKNIQKLGFFLALILCACEDANVISEGFFEGVKTQTLRVALKMNKSFDANETINADLFLGYTVETYSVLEEDLQKNDVKGFCLYAITPIDFNIKSDYKNPENGILLKEIVPQEFLTEKFATKKRYNTYTYSHEENLNFDLDFFDFFDDNRFTLELVEVIRSRTADEFRPLEISNKIEIGFSIDKNKASFWYI